MNKITRNNYEEFFIDYFDGNLNNHQVAELMLFLAQNSDLDNEFNQFKYVELKKEPIKFEPKNFLKKTDTTITGSVFFDKCIDKIENNLPEEKLISFNKELETDINKKKEFEIFTKTIIKPDLNITFNEKEKLKRSSVSSGIFKLKRVYQYAAILVVIFISYFLFENNNEFKQISNNTSTQQIASVVDYGELSSFDKYDNQQAFTVIKRETPKIVAKSTSNFANNEPMIKPIYISKKNAQLIVVEENLANNNIPKYRNNKPIFYIPEIKPNDNIKEADLLNNVVDNNENCNPTMVKSLTNEIKSDVYISEMMSHYKSNDDEPNIVNPKSVWQLLGKKISELTGTKIEKIYNKDGEVSKLAINTNRFRVSKKIRK